MFVTSLISHAGLEAVKRNKGDIEWTPQLIKSFELIRHAIAHAPLLCFPDFNKPFYVATDASCLGIGGVLYQPDEATMKRLLVIILLLYVQRNSMILNVVILHTRRNYIPLCIVFVNSMHIYGVINKL